MVNRAHAACEIGDAVAGGPLGAGKVPFLAIDQGGGANIAGSNIMVGGAGGQTDFLPNDAYETLGLPAAISPNVVGVNTDFGLAMHPNSALLRGMLDKTSAATRANVNGTVIPARDSCRPIARGEQLSKVLERAGGVTDMAFPEGAVFVRVELKERERVLLDELSRRLDMDLASLALKLAQEDAGQSQALDITRGLADRLRTMEPTGRLVIDLPKLLASTRGGRRSDYDVNLMRGDKLYIPPITQEVTVTGEVFYPTSHLYKKGLDRESYVSMSGGTTQKADRKRIYVVRADGSVLPQRDVAGGWFSGDDSDKVRPGDTIVVPLDVERVRPINLWTNVSQIIYQLAIGAASAKAVGVF